MKKFAFLLLLVAAFAFNAYGQSISEIFTGWPLEIGKWAASTGSNPSQFLKLIRADTSENTEVNAKSGKVLNLEVAETPIANINVNGLSFASGKFVIAPSYVPTLAATPVAGTNMFLPGLNAVPTAASGAAAFIGAATPVVGQEFVITNNGINSIRAKASAGLTLNGATAGGWVLIPPNQTVRCRTQSATNQTCEAPVIPTPAGP